MLQTATDKNVFNEDKAMDFINRVVGDLGASLSCTLTYMGMKLGLFDALAQVESVTPQELAERTNTNERYIREWLMNQAAGGYVHYNPATKRYSLMPEQKIALTDETSPFYVGGGFYTIKAMTQAQPRISEVFQKGGGMFWGEHDPDLFVGVEKFFRPGYHAHLVAEWIPSLTGIEEKLKRGAKVADVGCGHGASTMILAKAFPNSKFYGFDNHEPSISHALNQANKENVGENTEFWTVAAEELPDEKFDLIVYFDCLHDMGNPKGAVKRAFEVLDEDGSVMLVEPMAGESVEENFNPVGRTFSGASTLCCTPNAMAYNNGEAMGAVATESAFREMFSKAGFTQFKRVAETPFNRIFEARK